MPTLFGTKAFGSSYAINCVAFQPVLLTEVRFDGVFGRPLVGPAGIPADRLKILREAALSALKDPELKVDAEKRNYELNPVDGSDMERLAKEVMSQPPAIVERMKKILGD